MTQTTTDTPNISIEKELRKSYLAYSLSGIIGRAIPDVLTSGNHGKIAEWRREQAERLTRERRPDLHPVTK